MIACKCYYPKTEDIGICPEDLLERLHENDRTADNPVVSESMEVFKHLPAISDIRGCYAIFEDIELLPIPGHIRIEGKILNTSHKICRLMKDVEKLAVFVCTAGAGFSDLSRRCNQGGEYLRSYIVDTMGSIVVEKAMDYIQSELECQMQHTGLRITNRYSPGYCNWPVDDQRQLFSLLSGHTCGVTLSSSCLMNPIKSVSGIIGIGRKVDKHEYSCAICRDVTCIYRRIRTKKDKSKTID